MCTPLKLGPPITLLLTLSLSFADLKAANVLLALRLPPAGPPGLTAKVSDFGLSFKLEPGEAHADRMFQGTASHMAPEVMVEGRQSKASDV